LRRDQEKTMRYWLQLSVPFSILLAAGAMRAPSSAPQDRQAALATEFVLEAGEHQIGTLLERSAAFLGRNYLWSEADFANVPSQTFELQQRLVLDQKGVEEVVSELAYVMGFVMLPVDEPRGIYEWIHRFGPKRTELSLRAPWIAPEQVLGRPNLQRYLTTSVQLQHLDAMEAANMLRPFLLGGSPGVSALTIGAAGDALLIQGFTDSVAMALELVGRIDVPPSDAQLEQGWRERVESVLETLEKKVGGN
jgi:hypothetical protein